MDILANGVFDELEELLSKIKRKHEQLVGCYNIIAVMYVSKKVRLSEIAKRVVLCHDCLVDEIVSGIQEAELLTSKVKKYHEEIVELKNVFTDTSKENHVLVIKQVDQSFDAGVRAETPLESARSILKEAFDEKKYTRLVLVLQVQTCYLATLGRNRRRLS